MSKNVSRTTKNKAKKRINNPKAEPKEIALKWLFVCTPFLLSLLFMLIKWIAQGYVALPGIKWNDEAVYIKLIESYSKFFSPKGYWGFDANHAIFGTGSAWSPAILAPYFIPAILFPVGYSFVYVCNIIYITLANAAFLLLAKPGFKTVIKLILAEATSVVFILYLNTNMSEMFRYALAILIAGLLYKMFFDNCPKWLKYVVTPLVILYAVQVYTFFAFCIPIYVFALLQKKKLWIRICIAIFAMGFITFVSYGLLHLISSNYNIAKTESLLAALSAGHVFAAIKSFLGMIKGGIKGLFDLRFYVKSNGVYIFHVMIALLLVVSSVITIFDKKGKKKDKTIATIALYSVCIFFFMYMTLYTIVPDTFMRGTEIVILFSFFLLMMSEDKYLAWALIICNATGLLFLPVNLKNFQGSERYQTAEERREWRELKEDLQYVITIKDSRDPWDNTILMYTMEPRIILAMPEGMGLNFVLHNDYYGKEPGYIFIPKYTHFREDWVEQEYSALMIEHDNKIIGNYDCVYDLNGYICYRRNNLYPGKND